MSRSLTNKLSLAYSIESALGVAGVTWFIVEPDSINAFGSNISKTARSPISKKRQRKKGATTDLDSSVEFGADLTMSHIEDFIEGFLFSTAVNSDLAFRAADVTATEYTVPALSAAQATKLIWVASGPVSLLFARGYAIAGNNGLKPLTADPVTSGTTLVCSGLAIETAPANAKVEIAGIRADLADLAITVTGTTATITSGNGAGVAIDFTVLGLTNGQFIHVGGLLAGNQFSAGAGYGRLTSIAPGQITLDKLDPTLATDPGTGETIDLLFGQFIRNVDIDHTDYLERSFQFEAAYADLDSPGTPMYEYAIGNLCNSMTFDLPLTDKATVTFGFVGQDTEVPTTTRKTGGDSAIDPVKTAAFNTTADIARLRITEVDETGLTTDFKSLSMTLNNGVTGEKVLGTLGPKFLNAGNFEVDIESQLLFTNGAVPAAIRNNTTLTMDFQVNNGDGAIYFDIASLTLGGGNKDFPVNESILINTTVESHEDATLATSIGTSLFAVVP